MKTILVPTDYSANAMHALRYACMLNSVFNGKIVLFHSYNVPVLATEVPYGIMPADDDMKNDAEALLKKQKEKIQAEFPKLTFDTTIEEGFAEDAITGMVNKINADVLVMGTQGASGLREALVGSITAAVMEDAACPVIAVPEKATVNKLNTIVFATNYALKDYSNLNRLTELAKPFNAEIILLQVSTRELDKAYEFAAIENFKERVVAETNYDKISFKLLENPDILTGLNLYLDEVKADLLAMSMHHRTFIQKMFSRSKTKKMAFHTHVPLLAFHEKE